ncbi:hypothetical protein RFI36_15740 [Acinetobacter gerneri]|uniref:Uncharacterized protein n=1 Tax=Acinetobacter gerneri TaxID=202952 RepID=A0AAW8JMY7_9GAMM|nr:hypothetical protein [Acinetobacter gerneri]MDQ9011156.1 hypothetical protein [Acinetobacter gerneri]MDQ9015334.1 hypothetical protein [Acinetobacter gerneri]MDQ9026505.1 hypothetical protein [Acinetobacter gerneri]MDQ9053786.1 hypothetical protein [Acinetobacter gerneri]MDQ9061414.1 hypothetical protein [Acinetobacter gerneri]
MNNFFRVIFVFLICMPYLLKAENVNYVNKKPILINNIESDYNCEKLLENKLEIYLACKDWKLKDTDIIDISSVMKPYISNYVESLVGTTPDDLILSRAFDVNGKIYIFFPNGFVVYFDSKRNYELKNKFKTYTCVSGKCKKFFLWSFTDEEILEKTPNLDFEKDIYLSKKLTIYREELKNSNLVYNLKDSKCTPLNDCMYFICGEKAYIYRVFSTNKILSTLFIGKVEL